MSGLYRGTLEELRPRLLPSLGALREDDRRDALALIRPELEPIEPTQEEAEFRSIQKDLLSQNYYAIHDDDLKSLEHCVAVAAAMYAHIPEPISLVGGLAVFLYHYRRKRAKLTMEQGVVLKTLTYAPSGGWTIAKLLQNEPLSRLEPVPDVAAILSSLKSVVKNDGTTTAFAAQDGENWRIIDA
jgi:hypothetical protein